MPSNRINDMLQDSRGFFWLATEGAGLVRYDGFEFKTYTPENSKIRPLFTALCEDRDGNIWSASDNTLIKYNGEIFSYYYLPKNQRVKKIGCAGDGQVIACTDTEIFKLGSTDTLEVSVQAFKGKIQDIAFSDKLYVASDSGLYVQSQKVLDGFVRDISMSSHDVFVAGESGVYRLTEATDLLDSLPAEAISYRNGKTAIVNRGSVSIISPDGVFRLSVKNGLPDERFKGCYLSNSGVLWLYSNQGLVKLENMALKLYNEKQGIGPEVFSVWTDGATVMAGSSHGVAAIERGEVINANTKDYNYGVVLAIDQFEETTWLGTERGLIKYDGEKYEEADFPEIAGGYIFSLKATDNALWIGTGLGIFRYRNGRLMNVSASQNLPYSPVYAISEAADGSLWFATYTEGFMRLHEGKWQNVRDLGGTKLDSLRFNTFAAVAQNEIWAGTLSEGLYHITEEGVENLSPSEIGFAEIKAMYVSDGKVWLTTNKGLAVVSQEEESYKVKEVTQVSRLVSEGFSPQALSLVDGHLVAGSPQGVFVLDLDKFRQYVEPPKLAITDIELFFGEIEGLVNYAEGVLPFYGVPKELKLPHDLNYLSFTMAGLTGYQPENLLYRYRMRGLSDNWTIAGSRREAIFTNIKPGNYTFEAQVTREGEDWVDAGMNYHFEIAYPLYQRWWFILLSVLFVGGLAFVIIYDRVKRTNQQLRLENSLLEMERKALRLQMNPHFIFNALDSISSFIFKNDPKQAVRYLNNFAKLMRLTLESSMEHIHPVETEVSVLKNYLELEKLRFQGKFEYEIEVDEEIDYDVGIPPMLIQPHVENAILHGIKPKEGKSFLSIRFILDDELLICEVEDDGIGRKASKKLPKRQDHRSMATQINRDRIRLLRLSKSDDVDIQIIDLENPTGTKVIIKLPAESI